MARDRLRAFLGVWAPLLIAVLLFITAGNFYFTTTLGALEGWRPFCAGGVVFVGGVLTFSTVGRYLKVRAARQKST